jgi:hypothetical protein
MYDMYGMLLGVDADTEIMEYLIIRSRILVLCGIEQTSGLIQQSPSILSYVNGYEGVEWSVPNFRHS